MGSLSRFMGRYLSWLANAGLLVLCCYLVAGTVNALIEAWLTPAPEVAGPAVAALPTVDRSWDVRRRILHRNLFQALLAPPAPAPVAQENLEATKLPLTLIGTVASTNPDLAWAALNHLVSREHLVVRAGDDIKGKARVERIEARRIVLHENGQLRELLLDDQPRPPPTAKKKRGGRKQTRASRKAAARRARRRQAERTAPAPAAAPAPAEATHPNTLSELLSEVEIVPKFDGGEMVGIQVNGIQPGGVLEGLGIQSGDVITELNGVPLTNPEDSARVLAETNPAGTLSVKVLGEQGEQVLPVPVPQEQ